MGLIKNVFLVLGVIFIPMLAVHIPIMYKIGFFKELKEWWKTPKE